MVKNTKISRSKNIWNPFDTLINRIRSGQATILTPLATILVGAIVYLLLNYSTTASNLFKQLAINTPVVVNSSYSYLALAGLAVLATIAYYYIDYEQHYKPLVKELATVAYSPYHHAKVVVIPRMAYRWKTVFLWSGYATTTLIALAVLITFQVAPAFAYAPNEFVTTWDTTKLVRGTVTNTAISIGADIDNYSYNYTVDWGDGNVQTGVTSSVEHDYGTPGVYTVKITGTFPTLYRLGNNQSDKSDHASQLLTVEQWGTNQWATMNDAFRGNRNIVFNAIDAPDLSNVTSMDLMFTGAINFNSQIDHWDVSNVTSMNSMFWNANNFNQPLNSWDTSSLQNINGMFLNAYKFNQDLDNWDVSQITSMGQVFGAAVEFNGDISTWNTSNVENFGSMFDNAHKFNQDITGWDTSKATSMAGMFKYATTFNQPIGTWNTSNVTSMDSMFEGAAVFNQTIGTWNTTKVTNMMEMFYGSRLFNQPINSWNVGAVTTFKSMFLSADSFNQPLNSWDLGSAIDITYMFYRAKNFNSDISNWDVSGIASMASLFREAEKFNQDIDSWDVSSVTDMSYMFSNAKLFDQPLNSWDTSGVKYMTYMFLSASNFNQPLDSWDTSSLIDGAYLFGDTKSFNQSIDSWNVSNLVNMSYMFYSAKAFNQPLNSWNVGRVTTMQSSFYDAELFDQPLNNWDVSKVQNMSSMFAYTDNFNQDLDDWITSSLSDVTYMFWYAYAFNGKIDTWDMSGVSSLRLMFKDAKAFNQPVNNWDVSNVTTSEDMFYNAEVFNQPVNDWNVSKMTSVRRMFYNAKSYNQSFDDWQTSKLVDMSDFVRGATNFNQSLAGLDMSKVGYFNTLFYDTNVSPYNYDLTLISLGAQTLQPDIMVTSQATYCQGASAKLNIISTYNWTIHDGGLSCPVPTVDTGQASQISSTGTELNGTTSDGFSYPVTETGFEYGEDAAYGQTKAVSSGLGSFSTDISGLTCETTYHYRAYAKSVNGTGYGSDATFTTDSCPPQSYPQTDFSLTVTPLQTGKIKAGDSVGFRYRITNEGPNTAAIYDYLYFLASPEFTLQSVSTPDNFVDQKGPYLIDTMQDVPPALATKYSGSYFTGLDLIDDRPLDFKSGDNFDIYIQGVANADFVDNQTFQKALYFNHFFEQNFALEFSNSANAGQDFFTLPGNNTATYTYRAPTLPDPDPNPNPPVDPDPGGGPTTPPTGGNPPTTPVTPPTPNPPIVPKIPTGLIPATKVDTGGKTPSFKELVEDKLATGKANGFTKKDLDQRKEAKAYTLTGTKAQVTKNLPWILLALLAVFYLIQAIRQYRQNQLLLRSLELAKQTHKTLESLVSIISHFLGTAATIISSSVELLAATTKQPGAVASPDLAKLQTEASSISLSVNAMIASLQEETKAIASTYSLAAEQQQSRLSLNLWVVLPSLVALVLLSLSYFGLSRLGVFEISQNTVVFGFSLLLGSILLLLVSFRLWRHQRSVKLSLNAAIDSSQQATETRRAFINNNADKIAAKVSSIKAAGNNVSDPRFTKLFNVGVMKLAGVSTAFSKIYQLTSTSEEVTRDLTKLDIQSALNRLKQAAIDRGVALSVDIEDNLTVPLLKNELDHLVETTVSNAIKFTKQGGDILVKASNKGSGFNFSVKDNGVGIESSKLTTLMQPFERATSNTTYDYDGLGLNLYITRLIAERRGGQLGLKSEEGKGSEVRFWV